MNKKFVGILVAVMLLGMTGCGKEEQPLNKKCSNNQMETVRISIWADDVAAPVITEQLETFKELHKEEVNLEFSVSIEGAHSCKATVLSDIEGAADIYSFADDQFDELYQHGALMEVTDQVDEVIKGVGGMSSGAADAVIRDDKLFAYPETASNGYFLYYNKKYFEEEDVRSLDRILEVCKKNDKKFTMDYSSGWYIYSFFKGAGLELHSNEDGTANICNWNATDTTITGVDVAEAMMEIAKSPAFVAYGDDGFVAAVESGEVIAGINGAWNVENVKSAWGDDMAASKLPTYTVKGGQKQMASFLGYKLMGINSHTKYPEWCMKIAQYLTSEKVILERCELIGECPANLRAATAEKIQENPLTRAISQQAPYSCRQNVEEAFWKPSSKLGVILAARNLEKKDLQQILDEAQESIVTPIE